MECELGIRWELKWEWLLATDFFQKIICLEEIIRSVSPVGLFRVEGGDDFPPSCLTASFTGCWGDADGGSPADSIFFAAEVDAASESSMFSLSLYN